MTGRVESIVRSADEEKVTVVANDWQVAVERGAASINDGLLTFEQPGDLEISITRAD